MFEIDALTSRAAEIALESGAVVYDAPVIALSPRRTAPWLSPLPIKLLQTLRGTPYHRLAHHRADVGSLVPRPR